MEAKTTYFSRKARHDKTGESWMPVAEDLKVRAGVSRTFTLRSAVVANMMSLRFPSTMTCSTVALRMFDFDGRLSMMVAWCGADIQVNYCTCTMWYTHGRTWFPPSCLFILGPQLLELRGEVESSFLVKQSFDRQVALRDCASIRREASFSNKGLV
jgi:hypothetical protein